MLRFTWPRDEARRRRIPGTPSPGGWADPAVIQEVHEEVLAVCHISDELHIFANTHVFDNYKATDRPNNTNFFNGAYELTSCLAALHPRGQRSPNVLGVHTKIGFDRCKDSLDTSSLPVWRLRTPEVKGHQTAWTSSRWDPKSICQVWF